MGAGLLVFRSGPAPGGALSGSPSTVHPEATYPYLTYPATGVHSRLTST